MSEAFELTPWDRFMSYHVELINHCAARLHFEKRLSERHRNFFTRRMQRSIHLIGEPFYQQPMRIQIHCINKGESHDTAWIEDLSHESIVDLATAKAYALKVIHNFNATLQPKEKPRAVIRVTLNAGNAVEQHDWEKTNLITINPGRNKPMYDTARCSKCLITGKRYGIAYGVRRDKKYEAMSYTDCATARQLMRRKKK